MRVLRWPRARRARCSRFRPRHTLARTHRHAWTLAHLWPGVHTTRTVACDTGLGSNGRIRRQRRHLDREGKPGMCIVPCALRATHPLICAGTAGAQCVDPHRRSPLLARMPAPARERVQRAHRCVSHLSVFMCKSQLIATLRTSAQPNSVTLRLHCRHCSTAFVTRCRVGPDRAQLGRRVAGQPRFAHRHARASRGGLRVSHAMFECGCNAHMQSAADFRSQSSHVCRKAPIDHVCPCVHACVRV